MKEKGGIAMTKITMVNRINNLYGEESKIAIWFQGVAENNDYKRTRTIFFKIISKYNIDK